MDCIWRFICRCPICMVQIKISSFNHWINFFFWCCQCFCWFL